MFTEKEIAILVGARIRAIRLEKGLTQVELGDRVNMEDKNIGNIENGRRGLRFFTIYRFIVALNISLEDFMKGLLDPKNLS